MGLETTRLEAWLIVTESPSRLAPIARVWYAEGGYEAVHTALRAYPDEALYSPATPSAVPGLPLARVTYEFSG